MNKIKKIIVIGLSCGVILNSLPVSAAEYLSIDQQSIDLEGNSVQSEIENEDFEDGYTQLTEIESEDFEKVPAESEVGIR